MAKTTSSDVTLPPARHHLLRVSGVCLSMPVGSDRMFFLLEPYLLPRVPGVLAGTVK